MPLLRMETLFNEYPRVKGALCVFFKLTLKVVVARVATVFIPPVGLRTAALYLALVFSTLWAAGSIT